MKTPKQKSKYGTGFVVQAALLAVLTVGCFAMCCSYTRAWFVTERSAADNQVELATYDITVTDAEGNELDDLEYLCPLAPDDMHYFVLQAEGTAYTGYCTVSVTASGEEASYELQLNPDQSGVVGLQAAEGNLLSFAFDWGTGEEVLESMETLGNENELHFTIEHSQTPHVSYDVAYGASLTGIADYYGISVEALRIYNGLAANVDVLSPIYLGQGAAPKYAIPYVEEHPANGPYVPKGDLIVTIESMGGVKTPDTAYIFVTGPNGYLAHLWYSDFADGSYTLTNLTAGEYEITLYGAEKNLYSLETTGDTSDVVGENAEAKCNLVNTYTRHVGDLILWTEVSGSEIPANAVVVLTGPDGTYVIPYDQFEDDVIYQLGLPTGEYTVELVDAGVENYDLVVAETTAVVNQNMTTYTEFTVEYERHVGDLMIWLEAENTEIPEDAVLVLYGPYDDDGYYDDYDVYEIPYFWFENGSYFVEDVPTGEYKLVLDKAEVENYDLLDTETTVIVERAKFAYTKLSVVYERHVGNLKLWVTAEGYEIPKTAIVVLEGPDDTYELPYSLFKDGYYYAEDMPTGEYTIALENADVDGYTLVVDKDYAVVKQTINAFAEIVAEYERHVGNLSLWVTAEGYEIPETAIVVLEGPDDTYEIPYNQFEEGYYYAKDLPTGDYCITLKDADVDDYTLTEFEEEVTIEQDVTSEKEIVVEYSKQVGSLTISVQISGASLPEDAYLIITGQDGYEEEIVCEDTTLTDLPVGKYTILAQNIEADGFDVVAYEITLEVTTKGAYAAINIKYTAIESLAEETNEEATEEETEETTEEV